MESSARRAEAVKGLVDNQQVSFKGSELRSSAKANLLQAAPSVEVVYNEGGVQRIGSLPV